MTRNLRLDAHQWHLESAQPGSSFLMDLPAGDPPEGIVEPPGVYVDVEFRSSDGVTVQAVTDSGELLFLDSGQHLVIRGEFIGFRALSIECESTFAYVGHFRRSDRSETVDLVPAAVTLELDEDTTLEDAVADQMAVFLERLREKGLLTDTDAAEDIMEDLTEGDHEFEEEEDLALHGDVDYQRMNPEFEDLDTVVSRRAASERPEPVSKAEPDPPTPEASTDDSEAP